MGPFFLMFLPLSIFVSPRPRHLYATMLGFVSATVVLFVSTGQFERYFLAAIVPMALLAVAGWRGLQGKRRLVSIVGYVVICGLAGLMFPLKAYGLMRQLPALVSSEGATRILVQNTPYYTDLLRIRQIVPVSEPIVCMIRTCQYLENYRREDVVIRFVEQQASAADPDPRRVWANLHAQGLRYMLLGAPETLSDNPKRPTTLLGWLARCGSQVVYRNPRAQAGARDPRNLRTSDLVVIKLVDTLPVSAAQLQDGCAVDDIASPFLVLPGH
jgi:hypothetical protein